MAKKEKKTKAPKKGKQLALAGVKTDRPVVNAEVEKAAEAFREVRDERMAMVEPEAAAKAALEAAMKKHKLEEYTYVVDDEDGEPKKLKVSFSEETETTLTVRTVKDKKAKKAEAA